MQTQPLAGRPSRRLDALGNFLAEGGDEEDSSDGVKYEGEKAKWLLRYTEKHVTTVAPVQEEPTQTMLNNDTGLNHRTTV